MTINFIMEGTAISLNESFTQWGVQFDVGLSLFQQEDGTIPET